MDDQDSNNQVITIEPEISKILGLQDDFDLDPDEYLQLVREKLVQYDFLSGSGNLTDNQKEEQRSLAGKVREIRDQKKKGAVKYTTGKKINAQSFFGKKLEQRQRIQNKITDPSKLLPGTAAPTKNNAIVKSKSQEVKALKQAEENKEIVTISKVLNSILDTLKNQFKFDQKKSESDRKDKEKKKREARESNLEKGFGMVKGAVKKMLAPFQNILDMIWRYFFFTFLGKMFTDLTNWLNDPANKKKVEVLGRFLKDWWPLLLGAYLLFATPLGAFIKGTLKIVGGLTSQILKLLPRLLNLSKSLITSKPAKAAGSALANVIKSPFFLFPAAVAGTAALANEITGQRKAASVQAENKARAQQGKGLGVQGVGGVGDMGPITPYGMLQQIRSGGIVRGLRGYSNGAEVLEDGYGGIDSDTGISITGAGRDTQLIAARPGEVVLTPEDVGHIQKKTGFDVYGLVGNRKPSYTNFNKIKTSGGISLASMGGILGFNKGGIVGGKNPNINLEDYYSLLAISALEDDKPQGRADVAQSIYNRLLAANKYKTNFSQTSNSLKGLITAPQQYQPTFTNRQDWLSIRDKRSAAIAIMNSKKGRDHKWTLKDAMNQLSATESALKNPTLQSSAQKHVGGRAYFLGTSEQGNMKPGDVLRDEKHNFFSPWYLEGTPYDKERRNIASPIPQMLLPQQLDGVSSNVGTKLNPNRNRQNPFQRFSSNIFNLFSPPPASAGSRKTTQKPKRWAMDPRGWFGMQGGGEIPQGPFTPLPSPGYVRPQGSFIPKPMLRLPGPMPGTTVPFGWNPFKGLQGGGPLTKVTSNFGLDVPGGKNTADTEYLPQYNIAVQPGEEIFKYVIPKDSAEKGAGKQLLHAATRIVADTDSNSNAAKLGFRNKSINIRPYSSGLNNNISMLPPIKKSSMAGGSVKGSISGSHAYSFSPVLPSALVVRKMNCDIYGIVD